MIAPSWNTNKAIGISVRNIASQIQLQCQLDLAGSALEKQRSPCAGNRANGRVADLRVWIIKLWRVENVECLSAELQPPAPVLVEDEILEQRQVHLFRAWSKKNIASGVAERVVSRRNEVGCIEPGVNRGILHRARADAIRPLPRAAGVQQAAHHCRREWGAALEGVDAV